jgi:UrcA family protein
MIDPGNPTALSAFFKETSMNTTVSTPLRILVASAILGSAAIGFAPAASAAAAAVPPQVTVKFADLNVSTSQGAAALYRRIEYAAQEVCSRMYVSTEAYKHYKSSCLQKVIGDAVVKVDRPALSAVFESRYGVSAPVLLAAAGTH